MIVFDLWDVSVFVFEETSGPVWAEPPVMELSALFGLILAVLGFFVDHLCVSVGELAFLTVATEPKLHPVLTHLRFILSLVHSLLPGVQGLWRVWRKCKGDNRRNGGLYSVTLMLSIVQCYIFLHNFSLFL